MLSQTGDLDICHSQSAIRAFHHVQGVNACSTSGDDSHVNYFLLSLKLWLNPGISVFLLVSVGGVSVQVSCFCMCPACSDSG